MRPSLLYHERTLSCAPVETTGAEHEEEEPLSPPLPRCNGASGWVDGRAQWTVSAATPTREHPRAPTPSVTRAECMSL